MKISVAKGDGIGPQIMDSVLSIFAAAAVPLEYEMVEMGKQVAISGQRTGISQEASDSVETTGMLFKGPMETPKGGGYKSVNVTARKMWGTFANKRVYRIFPGVPSPLRRTTLDLTMVRENIEDTYGGIEHMQTHDVAQCRRLITRPGCEQVHRYTFEMAVRKGARRVTCGHKANIMKLTDGLFLDTFYEVARDYPQINADDVIVDAMAMKLVLDPSAFDVIVLPNLQGDILTDLAAGLVGGLAYAPSANIGDNICIFEAVHGTAPDIVGKDLANPSALLLSGTMMLRHLKLPKHAEQIERALQQTLFKMYKSPDLGQPAPPFSTSRFTETMLAEIGTMEPIQGKEVASKEPLSPRLEPIMRVTPAPAQTTLRGVDLFLESDLSPQAIGAHLDTLGGAFKLVMISNRGTQVWPTGSVYTDCINHYRVRYEREAGGTQRELLELMGRVADHYPLCGCEWLRVIDGERAYSLAQGQ